ncbi:MAG: pyrroline-5-carboxylate reductase [Gammaproteobacteria bacterium]|jgi:pyrroline-5-carboxylate reductase|nr:pyrroline-5-carboxylate reductase [Gammaproteobacteria bacterium]
MKLGNIGFIGGGNMGSSMVGGLIQKGIPSNTIRVVDHNEQTCLKIKEKWGVLTSTKMADLLSDLSILVLAVKPQDMQAVTRQIAPLFQAQQILTISIAAGITTTQIQRWLGKPECPVVRAMPNTPALLGVGISGLFATAKVTETQRQQVQTLMNALGETVWIADENLMDVVTALSGSGPAYFFYVMEGLIQGAMALGLSKDIASKLTLNTAMGSAVMALHEQDYVDVTQLRERVTSPNGTTEQGIKVLKDGKLEDLLEKTLIAATTRGKTLSEQYD